MTHEIQNNGNFRNKVGKYLPVQTNIVVLKVKPLNKSRCFSCFNSGEPNHSKWA